MEIANTGKAQELSVISSDVTSVHEVSEEFVLPDYIPEIRKLLLCRASVMPEGRFITENGVDVSGTVAYLVIYTDDEGRLCSVPLSSSYEAQIACPGIGGSVFIDTVVESTAPRVNAPRSISIKTRMKTRILATQGKEFKENISPRSSADEIYLERQKSQMQGFEISSCALNNIRMSDKFDMPSTKKARPLWCDATLVINEYKTQSRSISVRGQVQVKCICQGQDDIFTLTKTLPLAEELECEESRSGLMARVQGKCVSLSISNEMSNDLTQLFFDVCCELYAEVVEPRDAEITTDCYSTRYKSEQEYKEIEAYSALKMASASFSLSEQVKKKSGEKTKIIDQMATPVYEKGEIKGKRMTLSGRMLVDTVEKTTDIDNEQYSVSTYELPFKYEAELPHECSDYVIRASMDVSGVSARDDGDRVYINAQLHPSYTVLKKTRITALHSMTVNKDEEIKKDASCVRVYFPKDSDTLWEVAKKYHTTVNKIKSDNGIEELCGNIII